MATVRIILNKSAEENGKTPIYLQLSDRGKRETFATGLYAKPGQYKVEEYTKTDKNGNAVICERFPDKEKGFRFNGGKGVTSFAVEGKLNENGEPYTNKTANALLDELQAKALAILDRFNTNKINWSFDMFRAEFAPKPNHDRFLNYAEDVIIPRYAEVGKYSRIDTLKETIKSLKHFDSNLSGKMFQDLTPEYIERYVAYCENKGNMQSGIVIKLRAIKKVFDYAVADGKCSDSYYPFGSSKDVNKYSIKSDHDGYTKTNEYLTADSMRKLANAELGNYYDNRARHTFLLSFYTRGMNFYDLAMLTKDNIISSPKGGKSIVYNRAKTGKKITVNITPSIQKELDWFQENTPLYKDYLLPIVTHTIRPEIEQREISQIRKRLNARLREIAKTLEFPENQQQFTIYAARHSFAMWLKEVEHKDIEFISKALDHSNLAVTQHYLKSFNPDEIAEQTELDLSL